MKMKDIEAGKEYAYTERGREDPIHPRANLSRCVVLETDLTHPPRMGGWNHDIPIAVPGKWVKVEATVLALGDKLTDTKRVKMLKSIHLVMPWPAYLKRREEIEVQEAANRAWRDANRTQAAQAAAAITKAGVPVTISYGNPGLTIRVQTTDLSAIVALLAPEVQVSEAELAEFRKTDYQWR
jgi:hypothetical protein